MEKGNKLGKRVIVVVFLFSFVAFLHGCLTTDDFFMEVEAPPLAIDKSKDPFEPGDAVQYIGYDFSRIDAHARAFPKNVEGSMEKLVEYLCSGAENEVEKARAVYVWVGDNVHYDFQALFTGDIEHLTPEEVFLQRKGVCAHYSILFERLAGIAGLMAQTIVGVATGYPGQILQEQTNHAWNSVWLGDGWYLLDVTWGAGYLTTDKEFVRFINDRYFLTDPEEFIESHFPDDLHWQLLDHPISFDEFFEMAVRRKTD